jgi:hypothetical protein
MIVTFLHLSPSSAGRKRAARVQAVTMNLEPRGC